MDSTEAPVDEVLAITKPEVCETELAKIRASLNGFNKKYEEIEASMQKLESELAQLDPKPNKGFNFSEDNSIHDRVVDELSEDLVLKKKNEIARKKERERLEIELLGLSVAEVESLRQQEADAADRLRAEQAGLAAKRAAIETEVKRLEMKSQTTKKPKDELDKFVSGSLSKLEDSSEKKKNKARSETPGTHRTMTKNNVIATAGTQYLNNSHLVTSDHKAALVEAWFNGDPQGLFREAQPPSRLNTAASSCRPAPRLECYDQGNRIISTPQTATRLDTSLQEIPRRSLHDTSRSTDLQHFSHEPPALPTANYAQHQPAPYGNTSIQQQQQMQYIQQQQQFLTTMMLQQQCQRQQNELQTRFFEDRKPKSSIKNMHTEALATKDKGGPLLQREARHLSSQEALIMSLDEVQRRELIELDFEAEKVRKTEELQSLKERLEIERRVQTKAREDEALLEEQRRRIEAARLDRAMQRVKLGLDDTTVKQVYEASSGFGIRWDALTICGELTRLPYRLRIVFAVHRPGRPLPNVRTQATSWTETGSTAKNKVFIFSSEVEALGAFSGFEATRDTYLAIELHGSWSENGNDSCLAWARVPIFAAFSASTHPAALAVGAWNLPLLEGDMGPKSVWPGTLDVRRYCLFARIYLGDTGDPGPAALDDVDTSRLNNLYRRWDSKEFKQNEAGLSDALFKNFIGDREEQSNPQSSQLRSPNNATNELQKQAVSQSLSEEENGLSIANGKSKQENHKVSTEPWIEASGPSPKSLFTPDDGIDIIVDGARGLPDNVGASKIVVRAIADGHTVGQEHSAIAKLDGSRFNPSYSLKAELSAPKFDPTTTILFRIDAIDEDAPLSVAQSEKNNETMDSSAQEKKDQQPKCIGYALLNIFCLPGELSLQPADKNTNEYCLTAGAYQLPLHRVAPRLKDKLYAKQIEKTPRVLGATILVRIGTSGSLAATAPDYGTAAYNSTMSVPTNVEKQVYAYRSQNRKDETIIGSGHVAQAIKMSKISAGGSLFSDEQAKLDQANEFVSNTLNARPVAMLDHTRATPYSPAIGLGIAVDGLLGCGNTPIMAKGEHVMYKVITVVSPPGLFLRSPSVADNAQFTLIHDMTSFSNAARFKDGARRFKGCPISKSLAAFFEVRPIKIGTNRDPESIEVVSDPADSFWTAMPLVQKNAASTSTDAAGKIYTDAGSFILPLFRGRVPESLLQANNVFDSILAALHAEHLSNKNLSPRASAKSKKKEITALQPYNPKSPTIEITQPGACLVVRTFDAMLDDFREFVVPDRKEYAVAAAAAAGIAASEYAHNFDQLSGAAATRSLKASKKLLLRRFVPRSMDEKIFIKQLNMSFSHATGIRPPKQG